jgi:AraC family transcriptional regulator of adaptative response / DNA-3-methyladenine glycosylase II
MSPVALRRGTPAAEPSRVPPSSSTDRDYIRLSLAYRAPLDWSAMLRFLGEGAIAGVESIAGLRYSRTVCLAGRSGIVSVENQAVGREEVKPGQTQSLTVAVTASLIPALMPLLVRIRQILDLDAEPAVVDRGLVEGGLGSCVERHPGLRIPGVLDGFEAILRVVLPHPALVVESLGRRLENGTGDLSLLLPDAARVAEAGPTRLVALGVPLRPAEILSGLARAMAEGQLRLEQGSDVADTRERLRAVDQVTDDLASRIIMRALPWPDAMPLSDPVLMKAAGVSTSQQLQAAAERWRPWRAYAAHHLWLHSHEQLEGGPLPRPGGAPHPGRPQLSIPGVGK